MAFQFEDFFISLDELGIMVLLAFLLVFTIIYAVLDKTKIMGEGKRNMNMAIAIIFALMFIIPHVTGSYPGGYDPVQIMIDALPSVSLVIVAVIALMILIGVFAHDRLLLGATAPGWVALFSVVTLVYIFGSAAGWWDAGFINWMDSDVLAIVIMILVFGIIIAFVTGGGERSEFGAAKRLGFNLGDLFGGRK